MSEKKKLLSKFEVFLLVGFLGAVIYFLCNKFGLSLTKKTETVEIIERPNSSKYLKKKTKTYTRDRSEENRKKEQEVEDMLDKLRNNLYDDGTMTSAKQISDDEVQFHQDLNDKYDWNDQMKDNNDWFTTLKRTHNTYSKVKSIFADPNEPSGGIIEDVTDMMSNPLFANSVYRQMEEYFNIPQDKSKQFAEQGRQKVSDWAKFVEENEQK